MITSSVMAGSGVRSVTEIVSEPPGRLKAIVSVPAERVRLMDRLAQRAVARIAGAVVSVRRRVDRERGARAAGTAKQSENSEVLPRHRGRGRNHGAGRDVTRRATCR